MPDIRSSYTDKINFFGGSSPLALVDAFDTPLYVYNEKILRQRCRELKKLSSHPGFGANYSVKANSNPALLRIIRQEGLTVDAMSPGELGMDCLAGFKANEILYISNNNSPAEMRNALENECLISVDSLSQLEMLGRLNRGGRVMCRINPGIGAGHSAGVITGGASTKFGIEAGKMDEIIDILAKYELTLAGLNQHIGSCFMQPDAYLRAAEVLLHIGGNLPAHIFRQLEILDFGGGFGIPYHKYENEPRLDMESLGRGLHELIGGWRSGTGYTGRFLVEPGRYVVAECGLLLGRVTAVKYNGDIRFVGTDLGFNVLQRPMLYNAWHDVEIYRPGSGAAENAIQTIVGNICESGDILARDRLLPLMEVGDIVGILDSGAYGFSMASNYNERFLPAEVLLGEDGSRRLIRRRQTLADLESCLEDLG